jgi:hypothetical protein
MIGHPFLVIAVVLLGSTNFAQGSEPPVPRQPLGSMIPPQTPVAVVQAVPADRIRLLNRGNQKLNIAYRDGRADWRQIIVEPGQPLDLSCSNCTGAFTVAMHNGKEPKEYQVSGGAAYLLGWSDQLGVWVLTSSR